MVLVQVGTWTPNGSKYEMVLFFLFPVNTASPGVPIVQIVKHWPADPAVPLEMGLFPVANTQPFRYQPPIILIWLKNC